MSKKKLSIAGAIIVVGLALAGCSSTPSTGSSSKPAGEVKIDLVADLTGADAATDGTAAAGVQAAVNNINAHGGFDGQKVKLTSYDAQSTPNQAALVARQAVANKPRAIVWAALSSELASAQPVLAQAGIPVLSDAAVGSLLSPKPAAWYFALAATPQQIADSVEHGTEQAIGDLKGKRIAFNGFDSTDTKENAKVIQTTIEKAGATLVDTEWSEGVLTSYGSQAQKILAAKADAVITLDLVANDVVAGKALKSAGFTGPFIGQAAASEDSTFAALKGVNYHGERTFLPPAPGSAAAKAASAAGVETTGGFFGNGWAAVYLALEASKNCSGACDGTQMSKALEKISSFTPPGNIAIGPLKFSASRHYGLTTVQYFKLDSSDKVVSAGKPSTIG